MCAGGRGTRLRGRCLWRSNTGRVDDAAEVARTHLHHIGARRHWVKSRTDGSLCDLGDHHYPNASLSGRWLGSLWCASGRLTAHTHWWNGATAITTKGNQRNGGHLPLQGAWLKNKVNCKKRSPNYCTVVHHYSFKIFSYAFIVNIIIIIVVVIIIILNSYHHITVYEFPDSA